MIASSLVFLWVYEQVGFWLLWLLLRLFLLLSCLPRLNTTVLALSYYVLFCYVWLLCLKSSFFSNEKQKGSESGGKGKWRETGRSRGRGNCSQNILYKNPFSKEKEDKKRKVKRPILKALLWFRDEKPVSFPSPSPSPCGLYLATISHLFSVSLTNSPLQALAHFRPIHLALPMASVPALYHTWTGPPWFHQKPIAQAS